MLAAAPNPQGQTPSFLTAAKCRHLFSHITSPLSHHSGTAHIGVPDPHTTGIRPGRTALGAGWGKASAWGRRQSPRTPYGA